MSLSPRPTWRRELLTFFGSLRLAIFLLLLIAAASTIGTLFPQDQGPGVIQTAQFSEGLKAVLMAVQAYDVYHAIWFNFLLAMLFLNLAVCTYLRYPPTWRRYAMHHPATPPQTSLQESVPLGAPPTQERLDILRKRGYHVTWLEPQVIFAEKNKFVRLGPTIIHISLFAILTGAIVGGLAGLKNSFPVQIGQVVRSEDMVSGAYLKGALHHAPAPFDLRLDAFRMDLRPNGQVKQYYSDITVIPRGGVPYHQTIWVNEPLVFEGMYFYQSFWGIGGLTYSLDGQKARMELVQSKKVSGYMSRPLTIGGQEYMFFLRSLEEPALLVSTKDFEPKAQLVPGLGGTLHGKRLVLEEYHLFSGIETKQDPGIPLVYFGCGVLILGLALVPFSHRELWIRPGKIDSESPDIWWVAGRTHKGRLMLRKELELLATLWGQAPPVAGAQQELGVPVT